MRGPSNKALAVLELLRELGEMSVSDIAAEMQRRTPCGVCNGSGEGDDERFGCRICYGRGHVIFSYSDAYQALISLLKHELVVRRHLLNEWNDELREWVWRVADGPSSEDPLEQAFAAPAFER